MTGGDLRPDGPASTSSGSPGEQRVPPLLAGGWAAWAAAEAAALRAAGRWRSVRDLDGPGPATTVAGGRPVVSFASNDYLGLSRHPAVVAAAHDALDRWGAGAGSARLVAGARPLHRRLEESLAAWKGTEAAVLFPTGYAANLGVLGVVGGPGVTVVSDELNHASIVDGCRLSRSRVVVTAHLDVAAVQRALRRTAGRAVVVTESVFSMDGDLAPLDDLAAVCRRAGALLVVDEAHAVLGPDVPASAGVLRIGTLSKALGSLGGFAAGPAALCELLVNRARTFVFTTASTPADTAAGLAAVEVVRSAEGDALRARLRANVDRLRPGHPSPIVPVVVGDEEAALGASRSLLDAGLLVPAIRPPTVPPGTSRLRVSLSAAHTADQVDRLAAALAALGPSPRRPARSGARPRRLVVVLGTGTGVGKTWVAASLARVLRERGRSVAARKPVQSFEPGDALTDADVLACATGVEPAEVCPPHRWYEVAMAPPMAAEALGRPPFSLADLIDELAWPEADWGLVEGVGGPRSPVAADADNVALARALRPDAVVLVAPAGLGAVNAVLLATDALAQTPVVVLNRYEGGDPVHAGNRRWLESRGMEVVTAVDELVGALG